jgi:hypothetical protein
VSESTLSLKLSDLAAEVGLFLGYGRGAEFADVAWSAHQAAAIESIVRSGLRQFYYPPPLDNSGSAYEWSFLKPVADLTLAAAGSVVTLPDDFGGFDGDVTVTTDGAGWCPLQLVGEGLVRQRHAEASTSTGRPQMASVRPVKGTGPTRGQRFELYLWPAADGEYALRAAYYLIPEALTGARPYAYGGAPHVETILESCLAIAEQRLDDASSVHSEKFKERLAASVSHDRRLKPQLLGYNGDRSDRRGWYGRDHGEAAVRYNGTLY